VPVDNAVGTNDLWNAISLVHFKEKKADIDIVKKDFLKYVSGGSLHFTPVFSKDTIGYGQTRRFVTFNLKTKHHIRYKICNYIEESIHGVQVVNGAKRIFLFNIDYDGFYKILRLADLSTDKVKVLGELKIENKRTGWTVYKDRVFLFQNGEIKVLDLNFKPVHHPVVDFIMANRKEFSKIIALFFHPKLNFVIAQDFDRTIFKDTAWLITWNEFLLKNPQLKTKEKPFKIYKLFQDGVNALGFEWSPDHRWVKFFGGDDDFTHYFLMKVDRNYLHYLSPPIPIGEVQEYPSNVTTWTTNPLSFVVAGEKKLIRYNVGELQDVRIDELVKMIDELNE
jgi:hypothetical protein